MPTSPILSDRDAIHRRVLETPEDDAPRLILSDILEEAGEEERAEFIRVQIEIAKHNPYGGGIKYGERLEWLRERERDLFDFI